MKLRVLFMAALALSSLPALGDGSPVSTGTEGMVSVSAKADDVRNVLHDLFSQAKKNYVLEPGVRFALYLNLANVEFEEALQLILLNAGLQADVQNGIYFIAKKKTESHATPKTVEKPKPAGPLPETVLQKKVNTRLAKADMRVVFAEISKQSGIPFEYGAGIPALKLDAFLLNTSVKFALDQITQATGLKYRFTNRASIEIYNPNGENRVTVVPTGPGTKN